MFTKMNNETYIAINQLAALREKLEPIVSGEITRGCACKAKGDLSLEPGKRKTRLSDAKKICGYAQHWINELIKQLEKGSDLQDKELEALKRQLQFNATRSAARGTCEKCNTPTNWIVMTGNRGAYWCGCDSTPPNN